MMCLVHLLCSSLNYIYRNDVPNIFYVKSIPASRHNSNQKSETEFNSFVFSEDDLVPPK